jgi:hypothetical protein
MNNPVYYLRAVKDQSMTTTDLKTITDHRLSVKQLQTKKDEKGKTKVKKVFF